METTTQANGHMTNGKAHSHQVSVPAIPGERSGVVNILGLVKDAVEQELALKATMKRLQQAMKEVGPDELPSVLVALAAVPTLVTVPPPAPLKGPGLAKVETTFYAEDTWKGKIVALMTDGRERKASAIVKTLKASKHKSAVHQALSDLVKEDALEKPAYAHYRIKR